MRTIAWWCSLALAGMSTACGRERRDHPVDAVPAELVAPVATAEAAMTRLQERLAGRLGQALAESGAHGAVTVCRDEAQQLTAEIAAETGLALGRTSHRLRNPKNGAPSWAQPYVEAAARGEPAASVVVPLDDRVGVLRPVFLSAPCLQCHGPPESIDPEVLATLRAAYPDDRATGFAAGQLRGFLWAEAPLLVERPPP